MAESAKKDRIQNTGTVLIIIGIGMWGVYAVGKYWLGWSVTDRDFLPYHLAVIIPGMILRHYHFYINLFRKWFPAGSKGKSGQG